MVLPQGAATTLGCAKWCSIGPGQKRWCCHCSSNVEDPASLIRPQPISMCALTPLMPKELVPAAGHGCWQAFMSLQACIAHKQDNASTTTPAKDGTLCRVDALGSRGEQPERPRQSASAAAT